MKKIAIIALALMCSLGVKAQGVDMFAEKEIMWLGLDFTGAKLIGTTHFQQQITARRLTTVNQLFDSWNAQIVKEEGKFNIQEFYLKRIRTNDLLPVNKRNNSINPESVMINDIHTLSKEEVGRICSTYTGLQKESGLALLFVVESFDFINKKANIYTVFIDIADARPVYIKKFEGIPSGSSRNLWIGGTFIALEKSFDSYRRDLDDYKRVKKI